VYGCLELGARFEIESAQSAAARLRDDTGKQLAADALAADAGFDEKLRNVAGSIAPIAQRDAADDAAIGLRDEFERGPIIRRAETHHVGIKTIGVGLDTERAQRLKDQCDDCIAIGGRSASEYVVPAS